MQHSVPAHRFKIGDKAVYPARGVAEVVGFEERDVSGERQRFYVLRLLESAQTIMVPVDSAQSAGMREPIGADEANRLLEVLRASSDASSDGDSFHKRQRIYADKLRGGNIFEAAEVLRELYRLRARKALSYVERRTFETAQSLVVKELAIARGMPDETVRAELEALLAPN